MLEALLKFMFIVIIIYYIFKTFIRYALPWFLTRFMKKQQEKFNNMGGNQRNDFSNSNEGDVKVKSNQTQKSSDDGEFGEYVDFEEVDDK